jgi:transposase-like protein
MQRVPPSVQRQQALTQDLQAVFAGHPLRQFLRRAAEALLQVGVEEVVTAVLGRDHYERAAGPVTGYRNGYGHHSVKTEAGPLHLRPPKVRQTAMPVSLALPATLTGMPPELGSLIRRAYVRGLSLRDIEGRDAEGFGGTVSKSAASRVTAPLQAKFDT